MGLDIVISLLIIIMAVASLITETLRSAIVFYGILSLLTSFLFLIYLAPDVALAEAVIGSGLVTLVFLLALRQYKVYRVCFVESSNFITADRSIRNAEHDQITESIEQFCRAKELELQLVVSRRPLGIESENSDYDIVLARAGDGHLEIHGNEENTLLVEILWYLQWNLTEIDIHLHQTREEP